MSARRRWSEAEIAAVRERYPHESTEQLAASVARSVSSVYQLAARLDLHKTQAYLDSPAACRLRRGDHVGRAFWFPKGHVPANKGQRRPGWAPGRMGETQFRTGERRGKAAALHMPVGSTRLIDGYVYRKVSDISDVPYTVNWKPEHHLVWTAVHGPIPAGHALVFRDGNRQHCAIENLQLVSRADLMRRNSLHNLPQPLVHAIQLLGALKRQIRERSDDAEHAPEHAHD